MLRIISLICWLTCVGILCTFVSLGMLSLSPSSGLDVYAKLEFSGKWWVAFSQDAGWREAAVSSLGVACLSTAFTLALTLPVALYWYLKNWTWCGRVLLMTGVGLCLPPIVMALGLQKLMFLIGLFDTRLGLAIGHLVYTLPAAASVLAAGFITSSRTEFLAAQSLGASDVRSSLTWLLCRQERTLIATLTVSVLISLAEATITIYVTDTNVPTLVRKVLSGAARDISPSVFASFVTVLLATGVAIGGMGVYASRSKKREDKR